MDLLYLAYCISLFLAPIIIYILLRKPNKSSHYSKREWYHFLKAICAKPYVERYQRKWAEELKGMSDHILENPKTNLTENEADSQIIYGANTEGDYFCLKITLKSTLHAEVAIEFRHKNGSLYRLPNEPQVLLCSIASRKWKAAGLSIEVLQPFQRLRITYNGLMKKSQGVVEHVKFHFLWNSATSPLRYPQDIDTNLLVEAVAREPWKDGDWMQMLGSNYGYDQFGALNGFFNAKSLREENFVYMPSWRRRTFGPAEAVALRRDFFIFSILKDGTAFTIGAKCIKRGCTQLPYGCIVTSNGRFYSISSNDISLEHLGDNGDLPNAFSVHFQANGRTYKCVAHVNTQKASEIYNLERRGWNMKISTAECDVNSEQARAVVTSWHRNSGDGVVLPAPLLAPKSTENPQDLFVVQLGSKECLDDKLVGGKGVSLGMLSYSLKSEKFEVPPGFVVTTTSFRHQLQQNPQLLKAIDDLADICYKRKEGDIQTACKITAELFGKTSMTKEISDIVLIKIKELEAESPKEVWKWAVRSSGLDEDSEELSAAGQNTTILGCKTHNDVLNAVCACWGSLFSFTSVEYRRRHGIPINAEMGVVIQKMVPADCAGVLFTRHPSNEDPTVMVITSNYGLGESVVSGSSDPDTISLTRDYADEISLSNIEIGKKKTKIILGDGEDMVEHNEVDEDSSKKASISEEQAVRLGKIGILLEKKYGNPRDVEWAVFKDTIYLLQSRPITTLNTWTDWELQHEFDSPIFSKNNAYTRANIGEVCKGAMTPLSLSVVSKHLDESIQTSYGREFNPYCFGPMAVSSHTLFLDMMNYMYAKVPDKLNLQTQVVDLAIFGHVVFNEDLLKIALRRHGATKGLKALKELIKAFRMVWNHEKTLQEVLRFNNYWQIKFSTSNTVKNMLEKVENHFTQLIELCTLHLITSRNSITYQMAAMMTMVEDSKEFTAEHYTDVALLLSTNADVESAGIPVFLEGIVASIKHANMAEKFAKIDPNEGMEWLKENCPNVRKKVDDFLQDHGHRLFREFELKEKTWDMDPSTLIAMIQANCLGETTTKKAKGYSVDETIARLTSPKRKITKYILKFLVKKCRHAVASREKSKSALVRGVNRFRIAYRKIAKRMVSEGYIPEEDLVFYLTHQELTSLIDEKSPGLIQKALRRRRLYEKWNHFNFPELNYGIPQPEQEKDDSDLLKEREGGVRLQGTPVCEGIVVARACVITEIEEAKSIQQGDVLITTSTDIAWSPYFPMLSGVVTELGGLISHGAVVAREYGLPCVVGVQNATKYFKTGDKIRLSGKSGLLELME